MRPTHIAIAVFTFVFAASGLGCKLAADRGTGGKTPEKGKIAVKTRLDFTDSGSLRAKSIVGTGGYSFAMFAIDYAINKSPEPVSRRPPEEIYSPYNPSGEYSLNVWYDSEAPAEANKFDLFVKIFGENSVYPIYSGFVKGVDLSQYTGFGGDCDETECADEGETEAEIIIKMKRGDSDFAPLVYAGADVYAGYYGEIVFDASYSFDPEARPLIYSWKIEMKKPDDAEWRNDYLGVSVVYLVKQSLLIYAPPFDATIRASLSVAEKNDDGTAGQASETVYMYAFVGSCDAQINGQTVYKCLDEDLTVDCHADTGYCESQGFPTEANYCDSLMLAGYSYCDGSERFVVCKGDEWVATPCRNSACEKTGATTAACAPSADGDAEGG